MHHVEWREDCTLHMRLLVDVATYAVHRHVIVAGLRVAQHLVGCIDGLELLYLRKPVARRRADLVWMQNER